MFFFAFPKRSTESPSSGRLLELGEGHGAFVEREQDPPPKIIAWSKCLERPTVRPRSFLFFWGVGRGLFIPKAKKSSVVFWFAVKVFLYVFCFVEKERRNLWIVSEGQEMRHGLCHFGSSFGLGPGIQILPVRAHNSRCGWSLRLQLGMFPSSAAANAMRTISDVKLFYQMEDGVWSAFVSRAGDPGEDMRLLASLPPPVIATACEVAELSDGTPLTAIQAAHVGLVYRLCRRILFLREGGNWDNWEDVDPWQAQPQATSTPTKEVTTSSSTAGGTPERKLKLSNVLDQSDDSEFQVLPEGMRAKWHQQYLDTMGGPPEEDCEPMGEQLSALYKKVFEMQGPPYCDFGIFVPYGRKQLRSSKFRAHVLTPSGYVMKEIPGPTNFPMWRASFRVYKTALIMLDIISVANLMSYEGFIERLYLPERMALGGDGRGQCERRAHDSPEDPNGYNLGERRTTTFEMGPKPSMGLPDEAPHGRREVLERASPYSSDCMDGSRCEGNAKITIGEVIPQLHERRIGSHHASFGEEDEERFTRGEEKEEEVWRREGRELLPEGKRWRIPRKWWKWWKVERKRKRKQRSTTMLCMERQHRELRWVGRGCRMQVPDKAGTQMHEMQVAGPSCIRVSHEEVMKFVLTMAGARETQNEKSSGHENRSGESGKRELRASRNKRGQHPAEGREREEREDLEDIGMEAKSLEDYMTKRVFVFVHHFSGPRDPLGDAIEKQAKGKVKVRVIAVDRERTGEDLSSDRPYQDHLQLAKDGLIDGYHSGFPCSTYSRLRFRRAPGLPGPVRSKKLPYGLTGNSIQQQKESCQISEDGGNRNKL